MIDRPRRSMLFLPASNARAIAKARSLDCDIVVLDLEDAVPDADKAAARAAAVAAVAEGFGAREVAVRINAFATPYHAEDMAAVAASQADAVVVPKVDSAQDAATLFATAGGKPVWAMIETPRGVLNAAAIAATPGVAALIVGVNDLAALLRLPPGARGQGLTLALQTVVLAARASNILAFDGVYNRLDDEAGLSAEAAEGRALGFDGKSIIHPAQIAPVNRAFSPQEAELEDARALVAAATGGAERFRGRMIEGMHVAAARRILGLQ